MANAKLVNPPRAKRASAKVTMVLMVDGGAALSEVATRFSFNAPAAAIEVFEREPAKIKSLLQRYGEAVAKSHRAGRPVSFRVDVGPDGDTTVTPIDADLAPGAELAVETVTQRAPELERALEAARERGQLRAAVVLAADDMLNAEAFAKLLGTTRVTVNAKRQTGQVLGLEGAKRGFRFPVWQLDRDGKPYEELPALLERLGTPWAVYRFLLQPQGALDGMTGRQALEKGRGADAVAAAEGVARGDFT